MWDFNSLNFSLVSFLLPKECFIKANRAMKFNKAHIGFLFLVFLFLCLLAPYGCSGLKSENQKLKEKITEINAENDRLKKELNTLKGENSDMHARLAQLNQQISALQQEIQTLQKDLNSIKVKVQGVGKKSKKS
jgi:septal ring factor EnvC (AmiA/AmiB activator)